MMKLELTVTLLGLMIFGSHAVPKGYSFSKKMVKGWRAGSSQGSATSVVGRSSDLADLGSLPTNHAVGIATDPTNEGNLYYADETALYSFNKETGESSMVAGQATSGLLSMRSSTNGVGTEAAFKYITKLVSRPSGLYIFDYESLRKYDYTTQEVTTIAELSLDDTNSYPAVGVVSHDEQVVYWCGMSGNNGHLVMSMALSGGDTREAEFVTGGPTLIGHMEISTDGEYLLLADVDMAVIEKVRISDADITFLTSYGAAGFRPGALTSNGNMLYAVNSEGRTIDSYDITQSQPTAQSMCESSCSSLIVNPIDITYDGTSGTLFVLDGDSHPTLPTYVFSIKSLRVSSVSSQQVDNSEHDFSKMLQFYSNWLSSIKSD